VRRLFNGSVSSRLGAFEYARDAAFGAGGHFDVFDALFDDAGVGRLGTPEAQGEVSERFLEGVVYASVPVRGFVPATWERANYAKDIGPVEALEVEVVIVEGATEIEHRESVAELREEVEAEPDETGFFVSVVYELLGVVYWIHCYWV
jgi:hypothetical protein